MIGLLHDIGRFEQWKIFQTFDDNKSIDHGDYACKILFEDGLIKTFPIDPKYYDIIRKAIKNHNKLSIEPNLSEKELLHAKLIRDADKLDIFYYNACLDWISYPTLDEPVSPKVAESFFKHELSLKKDFQNSNDEVIAVLGYVYDFEFKESVQYLVDHQYLEQFEQKLNFPVVFAPFFQELKRYIMEEILCEEA